MKFQFTCPSRSTTALNACLVGVPEVSIHVPLAEHDKPEVWIEIKQDVSIHVPLAEHDWNKIKSFFTFGKVSIHVPLAEHDLRTRSSSPEALRFNSRAPRGARRLIEDPRNVVGLVSIHVPLAEHDLRTGNARARRLRFNSRAPRGARHFYRRRVA